MQNSNHSLYASGWLVTVQKIHKMVSWGILFITAFPLVVFMYQARYVRYLADDYSTAEVVVNQGFWWAQVYWYFNWTGSYTYTLLTALVELGGVQLVKFLPMLALGLWLILLFVVLRAVCQIIAVPVPGPWLGSLTLLVMLGTIRSFADYGQMLFWQTGIIAYQSNVIVFLAILVYFLQRFWLRSGRLSHQEYGIMFLLFLLAGGVSETWIVVQVAWFLLSIAVHLFFKARQMRDELFKMLCVGLAASSVSLLVTLLAPGNANHASSMETLSASRVFHFLFVSLGDIFRFLGEWTSNRTGLFILMTVMGFCGGLFAVPAASRSHSKVEDAFRLRVGALVFVGGLLMLWAGLFPGFVVLGVRPPDRAIFPGMFILLLTYTLLTMLVGWAVGSAARVGTRGLVQAAMVILLVPLLYQTPMKTGVSQVRLLPVLQLYARLWDERDAFLRQAGEQNQRDVVVQSMHATSELSDLRDTIWLIGELEEDPGNWKNMAAARYYGVGSITGER